MGSIPHRDYNTAYNTDDHQHDIPAAVNSAMPPILNMTVTGHGSACEHGQDIGEGDTSTSNSSYDRMDDGGATRSCDSEEDASVDNAELVEDDEDAEGHLIDVNDLGQVSIETILRAFARRCQCTCRLGLLPDPNEYPWSTDASPRNSGFGTPTGSMIVEIGSSHPSFSSSQSFDMHSNISPSRSNLLDYFMGGAGGEDMSFIPTPHFVRAPMWLAPTVEVPYQYPLELSWSSSDFEDFDT